MWIGNLRIISAGRSKRDLAPIPLLLRTFFQTLSRRPVQTEQSVLNMQRNTILKTKSSNLVPKISEGIPKTLKLLSLKLEEIQNIGKNFRNISFLKMSHGAENPKDTFSMPKTFSKNEGPLWSNKNFSKKCHSAEKTEGLFHMYHYAYRTR